VVPFDWCASAGVDAATAFVCVHSYVHGGYELLFNSYAIDYFKNGWWGAEIGNRHNMEVRDVLR
jgi:hypothetical protein